MNFCQKIFFITILFLSSFGSLKPIGAGVIFYRYTRQGELLFLMALDPYQSASYRKGFEFPAGAICDHDVDECDVKNFLSDMQPKDFLKGAIREALEELVFGPVVHSTLNISGQPYNFATQMIDENYEKKAIDILYAEIMKQGMVYLFKQQVSSKLPAVPRNQFALFFCDMTSFYKDGLLEAIQKQRNTLRTANFDFLDIGAEPNQFAWVKGSILESIIKNPLKPVIVMAEKVVNDVHVLLNQKITISDACFGMIRDRSNDQQNPQPNQYHIGDQKSSSMSSVLQILLNKIPNKVLPVPVRFNKTFVPLLSDFENKLEILEKEIAQFFNNQGLDLRDLVRRLNIEQEYKDLIFSDVQYWTMFKFKTDQVFHDIKSKQQQLVIPKGPVVVSQKNIVRIENLVEVLKAVKRRGLL